MKLADKFPQRCSDPKKMQGSEIGMANIKSAQKRIKVTEAKTLRNKMVKSALKTAIKKFETALKSNDASLIDSTFKAAVKALDMAATKGIIHKNMASRKKSRLAAKLKTVSA